MADSWLRQPFANAPSLGESRENDGCEYRPDSPRENQEERLGRWSTCGAQDGWYARGPGGSVDPHRENHCLTSCCGHRGTPNPNAPRCMVVPASSFARSATFVTPR